MTSSKRNNVAQIVAGRIRAEKVRLTVHARDKMRQEQVMIPEIEDVLASGWHVPEYDEWSEEHCTWNYAIEGHTSDDRKFRIAVSFAANDDVVIVTVIELNG
ncbi:MAG: DUF4258 domain-containing protein [Bradymonadaceae bacterium]